MLQSAVDPWLEVMDEFNEKLSGLVENFKETMITGFAEGLGALISGQSNFGGILTSMLEMMADFVVQFGKLAIQTGVAALSLANVFANPFAAIAAGVALVALGSAMKGLFGGTFGSGAPRLANGGIVSGRTLVEVGEYANAPINPEVIAPLDKLRSMINSGGSIPELITLRAKGDELISVIRRTDLINSKA